MTGIGPTLAGSLTIAAVSTVGDFIWALWLPEHRTLYGLIHGTVLFLSIGLFLGLITGHAAAGALGGALVGVLAAGAFYVLSPLVGFSAMFFVWIGVWMALGALYGRLRDDRPNVRAVISRGAIAAVASGLAFYSISGIWRPFNPEGWDYVVHFAAWTLAYLPGFAALFLSRR